MKLPIYQIDAFSAELFSGNPAAVCPLSKWLDQNLMQQIATENNLAETAFFVKQDNYYELRWFTPLTEVDLCGHATLAAAFVIMNELEKSSEELLFSSRSGELRVKKNRDQFTLNFPVQTLQKCTALDLLATGLGKTPLEIYTSDDYLAVFGSEREIVNLLPDFQTLAQLSLRGVIVTAPGDQVDFVSRFFAPNVGVNEDPVTGSAHCSLTPYWAEKLDKKTLTARQVSPRGGFLECELQNNRVLLTGSAVKYSQGEITI